MGEFRRILIVDDDADFLIAMRMQLRRSYTVLTAGSTDEAMAMLKDQDVDLVLLDVGLDGENGLDGIRKIHNVHPSVGVAMLSGLKDPKTVVKAIRAGAVEYLTKPLDEYELAEVVEKAVAKRDVQEKREALIASQQTSVGNGGAHIVYRSRKMTDLMAEADKVCGHDVNVLIIGKTGTGKELLARYINENANGTNRPFIAVNCSAIPDHLLESELFGHEAGAFTGANRRRIGKFEIADGGDIFLDEISTMKLDLQVKLLRVLQEKEFCRLGSNQPIRSNFRVIAASNQLIDELVESGQFREDLFHRVKVIQLNVPTLAERVEDIPIFIEYFLEKFSVGKKRTITEAAMARLMEHRWGGNVRELQNVIQNLVIMTPGDVIDEKSFAPYTLNCACEVDSSAVSNEARAGFRMPNCPDSVSSLKDYVRDAERGYIQRVIDLHKGDKSKSAKKLGIGRTTLYMKLRELGLM